jgi:hypothetical protein
MMGPVILSQERESIGNRDVRFQGVITSVLKALG